MASAATLPKRIFQVLSEAAEHSGEIIQVLQFNTLADALSDAFPHVSSKDLLGWKHREPLLHAVLAEHDFDFICAEEVDHFSDSFEPFLSARGYSGTFAMRRQIAEGDTTTSRDGTALFWKRDKYCLRAQENVCHASKTVGTVGLFARVGQSVDSSAQLIVGTIHLTAKPGQESIREKEVTELVRIVDGYNKDGEGKLQTIIGGDFNDVPESPACELIRSNGFLSAYKHDEHSWTTWKKRATEVKRVIDYIWYRPGSSGDLRPVALQPIPADDVFPRMLPDVHFPSDHMSIGAQFTSK